MAEARTNRRLAAILAADVVGYSRLMRSDESGTLTALKNHRATVFDPAVVAHKGRVVKLMGDGTLVEFGSVVDAVNCALAVQRAGLAEKKEGTNGPRIVLRIGVNLGDIIVEGDDIYGDGVNVAARLEALADPGGICVASIVNESVGSRVDARFHDAGEVQVKNIEHAVRIWKWHPSNSATERPATLSKAAQLPVTPSIAVLPFANMSGDPEQEYFSDGITEDIITDLSKVAGLLVIARNSSFAYKGKQMEMQRIASELRVGSVLEGSIRRAGSRVRITAQLIDARTGGHLWAERYDRDLTDIFAMQDEVTKQIVTALKLTLTPSEAARFMGRGTRDIEALDLSLRGRAMLRGPTQNLKVFTHGTELLSRAIERDPIFAEPYAALAVAYITDYLNRWTEDPGASLTKGQRLSDLAIEKDPNDAYAHAAAALVAMYQKDLGVDSKEVVHPS